MRRSRCREHSDVAPRPMRCFRSWEHSDIAPRPVRRYRCREHRDIAPRPLPHVGRMSWWSALPVALQARTAAYLDLASYTSLTCASVETRNATQERAASPALVCCRNMPVRRPDFPEFPWSESERQHFEHHVRCAHDLYPTSYAAAPLYDGRTRHSNEAAHELVMRPTPLGPTHLLVQRRLFPRVLDLHHVRLTEVDFLRVVSHMTALEMLCVDATLLGHAGTLLAHLPRLATLCMYAHPQPWVDTLRPLACLRHLSFPLTERFARHLLATSLGRQGGGFFPDGLTHLTLLAGGNFDHYVEAVGSPDAPWWLWLGHLPDLRELRSAYLLPPGSVLTRLVPRLERLSRHVRSFRSAGDDDDDDDRRGTPLGIRALTLHVNVRMGDDRVSLDYVEPRVLEKLTLRDTRANADAYGGRMCSYIRGTVARFGALRSLSLHSCQPSLDAATFRIVCLGLPGLERLRFATATADAFLDTHDAGGTRLLEPLAALTRLRTLDFGATSGIKGYAVPSLPGLTSYRVFQLNAEPLRVHSVRRTAHLLGALRAFPALTALHTTLALDDGPQDAELLRALREHACLATLHIATPFRSNLEATHRAVARIACRLWRPVPLRIELDWCRLPPALVASLDESGRGVRLCLRPRNRTGTTCVCTTSDERSRCGVRDPVASGVSARFLHLLVLVIALAFLSRLV